MLAIVLATAISPFMPSVSAGHFTSWMYAKAPFNGSWNKFGSTPPASHYRAYGGDWAVDYYQTQSFAIPPIWGYLNLDSSTYTSGLSAQVSQVGSACAGSNWAGYKIRYDTYDPTGYRGWYLVSHVNDNNGEYTYQPDLWEWFSSHAFIGWTYQWSYSSCYQVTNPGGVHWHIESWQPTHFACFFPWASAAALDMYDNITAIGSNATSSGSACF